MKKILITGGTGFIGSNFVHKFLKLGEEVHVIIRPASNLWRLESVKSSISFHAVDLSDARALETLMLELRPDIILHFAVYGGHQDREKDVDTMVKTNVLGTINLVNAASKINPSCFVNAGSSSEYGEKTESIKEIDLLEPNNLYGVTKAAGTLYCQYAAKQMGLPIVTVRPFSPYGYFEDRARFIPAAILAFLENTELKIHSGSAVRDFVFIEDVTDAFLRVIENIDTIKGEILNIGMGAQSSLADVVICLDKILPHPIRVSYGKIEKKQHEPAVWAADIGKVQRLLDWKPQFSLEDGLKKTVLWFQEHRNLYESR